MSVRIRYGVLRYTAAALTIVSYGLLAYAILLFIVRLLDLLPLLEGVTGLEDLVNLVKTYLIEPAAYLAAVPVVSKAAELLSKYSEEYWDNFTKSLIGAIESYRVIHVSQLASLYGESAEWISRVITRLRAEGKFRGHMDARGLVYAAGYAPPPQPPTQQEAPTEVRVPVTGGGEEATSTVDERLREIEEAYRKGLISEETYRRLLSELQKGRGEGGSEHS